MGSIGEKRQKALVQLQNKYSGSACVRRAETDSDPGADRQERILQRLSVSLGLTSRRQHSPVATAVVFGGYVTNPEQSTFKCQAIGEAYDGSHPTTPSTAHHSAISAATVLLGLQLGAPAREGGRELRRPRTGRPSVLPFKLDFSYRVEGLQPLPSGDSRLFEQT